MPTTIGPVRSSGLCGDIASWGSPSTPQPSGSNWPVASSRVKLFYPEPNLTDGVVTLRPWRPADAECARRGAGDREISGDTKIEVVGPEDAHRLIERKRQLLSDGTGVALALTDTDTDQAVGQVWIGVRPQPGVVGLGYWVLPEARGRRFARRAAQLAAAWALGPLGASRMEAWVRPENEASLRTVASAGFQREGVLRSFLTFGEERSDVVVWSRLSVEASGRGEPR
jgi:ribosomal-protein-alanine N-acetyltransferase